MFKRSEGKSNADYKLKDLWKFFCERFFDMPYSKYAKILKEINHEMMQLAIYENVRLYIPYLGYISVQKYKPKLLDKDGNLRTDKLMLDYQACWKLWEQQYPGKSRAEIAKIPNKELRYLTNLHTKGYKMHFFWDKSSVPLKGKSGYEFKASRTHNREIKKAVDAGADYFEKVKL